MRVLIASKMRLGAVLKWNFIMMNGRWVKRVGRWMTELCIILLLDLMSIPTKMRKFQVI